MNKRTNKRIIGLLIIIFAFIAFTPKSVYADDAACQKAQNDLKAQGAKKYSISGTYDLNNRAYTIRMGELSEILKKKITTKDNKNPRFKITGFFIDGKEVYGIDFDIVDASLTPGKSIVISDSNLKSLTYRYGTKFTLTIRIEPDNFDDPDLVDACGKDAKIKFKYELKMDYEYYNPDSPVDVYYDLGETSSESSEYVMNIDCNKSYDKNTNKFEYEFCDAKKKAIAAGAKVVKFGSKGGEAHQVYEDVIKDGPTSFKCNYNIDRANPSIWLLDSHGEIVKDENGVKQPNPDYYANTSYLIGEGLFELTAGEYVYHVNENSESTYSELAKCEVRCDEIVTIEYGQPVAAHGGICFEYKVRVTSRVDCGYDKEKITKPRNGKICSPTPHCVHTYEDGTTEVVRQGGPNDEFDNCVEKCDGGVYSDKCSNKCYKQVYGKSLLISQVSGYELDYATKVKSSKEDANPGECVYKRNGWVTNGYPRVVGGSILGCDSPWHTHLGTAYVKYIQNGIPAKENCKDECTWYMNGDPACLNPCAYTDGSNNSIVKGGSNLDEEETMESAASELVKNIDDKVINKGRNSSQNTSTTCNIVYYNTGTVYRKYHKTRHANGDKAKADSKYGSTPKSWAEIDLIDNTERYHQLQEKCKAAAKCNTSTAEFTISASYIDGETGKTVKIEYPYEDKKDSIKFSKETKTTACTSSDAAASGTFTTILDDDGCYNCAKGCDDKVDSDPKDCRRWYRTEWSFPGSWFSNKHNNLTFFVDKGSKDSYHLIEYNFCLPRNVRDVNEKWYLYYHSIAGDKLETVKDKSTVKNCPDGSKITCDTVSEYKNAKFTKEDSKNLVYNINASTRKFGFYEWDIDIDCFYASYMEMAKCSCDSTTENGQTYRVRVVDLKNLFPDSEGNELTGPDTTGRETPFNWSTSATQKDKDPNYQSIPSAYTSWVQRKGYDVYSDDNIDYEVHLTKEKINEIKKQNIKYNEFNGTFDKPGTTEKKSASTYQSDLIRKTLSDGAVYPSYETTKCNNIAEHTPSAGYVAKCEDFTTKEGK